MRLTRVQIHQIVLIVLLLALFPRVIKTWFNRLPKSVFHLATGITHPSEYFIAGSGLQVLPEDVHLMRSKVLELGLKDFKFSEGLKAQETYYQRLCESLYPLLPSVDSNHVIAMKVDVLPNCQEIATSKEMKIVHCP